MEEIKTGENPDQKSTTEEQIEEEGEDDPEEEEVTEETPAEEQEEQETVTEESEVEESETEEPEAPAATTGSETDSLVQPASTKILIKGVTKGDGDANVLGTLEHATIYFTDGCSNDEGTEVRNNVPITFRVRANAGYKVKSVKFGADADETALDTPAKAPTDVSADGTVGANTTLYTIPTSAFVGKDADGNDVNQKHVLIVVETEGVKYKIKPSIDAAGVKVNTVETTTGDTPTTTLQEITSAGKDFDSAEAGTITLAMSGMDADKTYDVYAYAGNNAAGKKPLTKGTAVTTAPAYIPYTLTFADLADAGLDYYKDQDITVTVKEVEAVTVDGSAITTALAGYDGVIGAPTEANIDAAAKAQGYVPYAADGTYKPGDKVVFTITPAANSNWATVEAAAVDAFVIKGADANTKQGANVAKGPVTGVTTAEGAEVFTVTIPEVTETGYTLNIKVNAELGEKAKTITFATTGNAAKDQVVTIKGGDAMNALAEIKSASIKTMAASSYAVDISSREGYQLQDVSVAVTGNYSDAAKTPYTDTYTLDEAENYGPDHPEVESKYPRYRVKKEIALSGNGTGDHAGQTWTATAVTVTVDVAENIEGADEEKQVTFGSGTKASSGTTGNPYKFNVTQSKDEDGNDRVKYEENADKKSGTVTIAEGVQYLEFSVAAETKPEVKLWLNGKQGAADNTGLLEKVSEAAGNYQYRVAAKALIGKKGHISITREKKELHVTTDGVATVTYTNTEDLKNTSQNDTLYSDGTAEVDINAPLDIKVTHKAGTVPIKSVTYRVGENGTETTVEPDNDVYSIEVKADEDVYVTVERVEDERLFVTDKDHPGTEVEIAPDSVVEANYEDTIKAYLLDADDDPIALMRATVYDGGKLAETKASVNAANEAVISQIAKNEYEKELTVTLMKEDRTTVSFKIVSDKAVEGGITYSVDGEKVDAAKLHADTTTKIDVSADAGTVNKLDAVAVPFAATVPEKVPETTGSENVKSCDLTNGTLTITAAALEDKKDDAALILVYDSKDTEKKVLSSLKVNVEAPVMKGVTAKAEPGLSDGRNVSVKITVPDEVKNEVLEAGVLGYEIKVTAPEGLASMAKPDASWTDADWNATRKSAVDNLDVYKAGQFVSLNRILDKNGYTIPVIDEYVTNQDGSKTVIKPAAISGIKITVTPVQYTLGDKETGYPIEGSKKITGTAAPDITMGTTAPIYSDTLNLGKGASAVLTGQDEDIVVATPVFAKDAQYKSVDVKMIDSSTGIESTSWNYAFAPKWNPATGEVTVNAKNASYITNGYNSYKNLAIKVTAWTEAGDYGVSGVKKLSVKNGIQNLKLTVQPEILLKDKKVTVKSAIVYNQEDNEYYKQQKCKVAPSKKAATFRLVGADSRLSGTTLTEKPLSANLTAVVDNKGTKAVDVNPKNGQITVAAAFAFGKNNTFRVLAEAADYAGNPTKALSDPITIISENEETKLGTVAVLEKNAKNQWVKATGDLPVAQTYGQYRLVVLRAGVGEKPNGYDLEKDTVDLNLVDIKSSNKSIAPWNRGNYADIYVNKLGKTSFTATAKSNNKNKSDLKNVNFVMDTAELYVELTRYQDSTFDKVVETKWFSAKDADKSLDITGNTTGYFSATLVKKNNIEKEIGAGNKDEFALPNCSYSFKNAKRVTPVKEASELAKNVYFVATGGATDKTRTVFTVTNKGVKPADKIEIKINNAAADAAKGNAPKLTLTDSKKKNIADWRTNDVSITVTASKKGEVIPADTYVMLSADQTKKTKADINDVFEGYLDTAIRLDKTGDSTAKFNVKMRTNQAEGYTLIATLGTMENGVFTQTYKEARITLKAVKPNYNIKATGSYTLNPYGASSAKLAITGGDNDVWFDGYDNYTKDEFGTDILIKNFNYAKNVIKKDGSPNRFNKFFIVTADKYGCVDSIKINPALTTAELNEMETSKDFAKDDTTGYITITNGQKTMDVKLTVKIKVQKDMKPKATVSPVIEGKNVITDIQITDGKNPIALEAYQAKGASYFEPYYSEAIKANKVVVDGVEKTEEQLEDERLAKGIIRMKAAEAKKGNDPITLKVLLVDTVDAYRVQNATTNPDRMKNGVEITGVKVTIAAATTTNKVDVSNSDKNWIVQRTDWNTWKDEESGYEFYGWSTQKDFSFKNRLSAPAGQKIVVKSDTSYVHFDDLEYSVDGKGKLNIDLDKTELVAAMSAPKSKVTWGKKLNVKATFTYPGTAEEGKEATDLFKSDVVTFSITLPEKEGYESADILRDNLDQKALQNFVDVKTAEEHQNALYDIWHNNVAPATACQNAADCVADMLKNEVLDMAKGTTAVITTKGVYSIDKKLYTYTLNVGEGEAYTYNVRATTPTAADVQEYINEKYGDLAENIPADKAIAETLGLQFHPEVTQAADLTTALRGILEKENLMTRNISVNVTNITCEPPKAGAGNDGTLTATVEIKDSNKEPNLNEDSYGDSYSKTAEISYTFSPLTETDAFTTNVTTGLLAKLTAESNKAITQIFSDAYRTSNGDIDDDHVIGQSMKTALIAGIEKFAGDQITTNPYLTVKGIDADDFACEWDGSTSWKLAFTMTYADATPETEEPEPTVEITADGGLTVAWATLPSNQDAAKIQTAANTAFEKAHYLIKNVNSAELAEAEIVKMIKDVVLNPKYKTEGEDSDLKVETVEDGFTAPTTDLNGMITVTISYDATNTTDTNVNNNVEKTFVIVKDDKLLGNKKDEDGEETNVPNLDDHAKAEDLVKAVLTADKLDEIVQGAWKTYAGTDGNEKAGFAADATAKSTMTTAVKGAVTKALTDGKVTSVVQIDTDPVTIGTITLPTGSAEIATGSIAEITVALKDASATGDDAWDGTEDKGLIKIPNLTLKGNELFQTEEDYQTIVKDYLKNTGLAYDSSYFKTVDGSLVVDDTKLDDIATAITNAFKTEEDLKATNPEWNQTSYTKTAGTATADNDDGKVTAVDDNGLKEVKLTLGKGDKAVDYVPVKLRTLAEMPRVEKVSVSVDGTAVPDTNAAGSPVTIANSPETKTVEFTAAVAGTVLSDADKKVTWAITDGSDATLTGGVKDVKINENTGVLTIPRDAYASANGYVDVKITATAAGTSLTTDSNKKTVYARITLTEDVTGITLTNSVDNKTAQTTFEAPATGDGAPYTFGYELVGSHIKADTKATFTKPADSEPADDKVVWGAGDAETITLQVKSGALDHSGNKAYNLVATSTFIKDGNAVKVSQPITIKSNETAGKETTLGFDTTGVTEESDWGWQPEDKTTTPAKSNVLTIKNEEAKSVRIPIVFNTAEGMEEREWKEPTIAVKGSGAQEFTAIDNDQIVVEAGDSKKDTAKYYLVVNNIMPEIEAAKDAAGNNPAVDALVLTLSATSTEKNGLAAVTTSLNFEIVVNKTLTDITIAHDETASTETTREENGVLVVTKVDDNDTTVTLKATVNGAHVDTATDADDQKVTWKVLTSGAKSDAHFVGKVLTMSKDSVDNVINVQAISTADKDVKGTLRIRVVKSTTP